MGRRKLTKLDKEALDALNNIIEEMINIKNWSDTIVWKNRLTESVKKYIGEKNVITESLVNVNFSSPRTIEFENEEGTRKKNKTYIDSAIKFIRENGVLENKTTLHVNWFYKLSTAWATTLIGIASAAIGTVSVLIATSIKDKDFIRLEYEYKGLRDSLRISAFKDAQVKGTPATKPNQKGNNDSGSVKH